MAVAKMSERDARALAICARAMALLQAPPPSAFPSSNSLLRVDIGEFRIALWTEVGRHSELIIWAPMPMLREAREKVLAVRWSLRRFEVLHFQRGTWEGDVFSLRQVARANRYQTRPW